MTDPVAIANALKAHAGAITGVVSARLGLDSSIPATPAAEVVLGTGQVQIATAGGQGTYQADHTMAVIFYVPLSGNGEEDETEVGRLVKAFIDRVHAPDFDYTLGNLVGATRATAYEFDVTERNNSSYRIGTVIVEADED
jgi:hypothetical protein